MNFQEFNVCDSRKKILRSFFKFSLFPLFLLTPFLLPLFGVTFEKGSMGVPITCAVISALLFLFIIVGIICDIHHYFRVEDGRFVVNRLTKRVSYAYDELNEVECKRTEVGKTPYLIVLHFDKRRVRLNNGMENFILLAEFLYDAYNKGRLKKECITDKTLKRMYALAKTGTLPVSEGGRIRNHAVLGAKVEGVLPEVWYPFELEDGEMVEKKVCGKYFMSKAAGLNQKWSECFYFTNRRICGEEIKNDIYYENIVSLKDDFVMDSGMRSVRSLPAVCLKMNDGSKHYVSCEEEHYEVLKYLQTKCR